MYLLKPLQAFADNNPSISPRTANGGIQLPAVPALQLVGAGRYQTKSKANLRNTDLKKIEKVPKGSLVEVQEDAPEKSFKLTFRTKAHTWTSYNGSEGWIKDDVLKFESELEKPKINSSGFYKQTGEGSLSRSESMEKLSFYSKKTVPISIKGGSQIPFSESAILKEIIERGEYVDAKMQKNDRIDEGFGMAGGLKMDEIDPEKWKVHISGGQIKNRRKQSVTGGGAWVLDYEEQLFGSQQPGEFDPFSLSDSLDDSHTEKFGGLSSLSEISDMEKHALADVHSALWAGEMKVKNGKPMSINNQSGTFRLENKANANLLIFLIKNKVIEKEQVDEISVSEWIKRGMDREGELIKWKRLYG
jgi:hypothetical protein